MEFLDDLRSQRESQKEPDEEPRTESLPPASNVVDPEQGEAAWDALLSDTNLEKAFEIPEEEPPKQRPLRRARQGPGLKPAQKIVLGVLAVLVMLIWGAMIFIVSRSLLSAETAPPPGDPGAGASTPVGGLAADMLTATPTIADVTPSPTPSPTITPTPGLAVSTSYDTQLEREPDNVDLRIARGREYLNLGAFEAAQGDFEAAIERQHGRPEAYVGLGWAQFYLWSWDAAQESFSTALSLDESTTEAHFGLGQVYFYQGMYAKAAKSFDRAAEIDPAYGEAEAWLGIAAAKMGQEEEARGGAERALMQDDRLAIGYIAKSWARRIQDPPDIDGAQADLLYAQELDPNGFYTLDALAKFYADFRPERLAEAERLAYYAIDWAANDVQHAIAQQTLGEVFLAQGHKTEAMRILTEAADRATVDDEILLYGLEDDLERAEQ